MKAFLLEFIVIEVYGKVGGIIILIVLLLILNFLDILVGMFLNDFLG